MSISKNKSGLFTKFSSKEEKPKIRSKSIATFKTMKSKTLKSYLTSIKKTPAPSKNQLDGSPMNNSRKIPSKISPTS